jgi:hypothetical protein
MIGSPFQKRGEQPMKAEYPGRGRQSQLQEVAAVFAQWRTARAPRSRIPQHLWQAAVNLAPCYSIHQIARALRLNYTALKHRIKKRPPDQPAPEFIEIDLQGLSSAAPCVLELRSPTGFELKIHNVDRLQLQLEPLIGGFLGLSR